MVITLGKEPHLGSRHDDHYGQTQWRNDNGIQLAAAPHYQGTQTFS